MRKLVTVAFLVLMAVGAWAFVKSWRSTTPLAVGTGKIAGTSSDLAARDERGLGAKTRAKFSGITDDPLRYKDQKVTVTGRVRGAAKLASNRNIYTLAEGDDRILVIDDKPAPKEAWPRTVNGVVKVVGPPVGGLRYAYVVDVREPAKFKAPQWQDIKDYFTGSPNR
jgi:hypothetical protein